MIGLDRMGASMVRRLRMEGHACVVHDVQPSALAGLVKDGAAGAASLKRVASQLRQPRAIWLMVPAAVVDQALGDAVPLPNADDIVVDGENLYYPDDIRRTTVLQTRGIRCLNNGTSGRVADLKRGYCLTIGDEGGVVEHLRPIFSSLAPGIEAATRTPGRKDGTAAVRGSICAGLSWKGVGLDEPRNRAASHLINRAALRCSVQVPVSKEGEQIARHAWARVA